MTNFLPNLKPTAINPNLVVVGISGNAGVGKDTLAEALCHDCIFTRKAFADKIKLVCSDLFDLDLEVFYDQELKNFNFPYWNKSPRELLQFFGTEMVRGMLSDNFWVAALSADLFYNSVITDVRSQIEAEWIAENNGMLIHLTRPGCNGTVGIPNHASEAGINWIELRNKFPSARVIEVENNFPSVNSFQEYAIKEIYPELLREVVPKQQAV